ncbi:MAG: hypothetical protein R3181_00255 [Rubricoccaceae bacterium]|nr:hypothetical protein [Rubricoccaceae bacterium]
MRPLLGYAGLALVSVGALLIGGRLASCTSSPSEPVMVPARFTGNTALLTLAGVGEEAPVHVVASVDSLRLLGIAEERVGRAWRHVFLLSAEGLVDRGVIRDTLVVTPLEGGGVVIGGWRAAPGTRVFLRWDGGFTSATAWEDVEALPVAPRVREWVRQQLGDPGAGEGVLVSARPGEVL